LIGVSYGIGESDEGTLPVRIVLEVRRRLARLIVVVVDGHGLLSLRRWSGIAWGEL
jgi:hypothetical protein